MLVARGRGAQGGLGRRARRGAAGAHLVGVGTGADGVDRSHGVEVGRAGRGQGIAEGCGSWRHTGQEAPLTRRRTTVDVVPLESWVAGRCRCRPAERDTGAAQRRCQGRGRRRGRRGRVPGSRRHLVAVRAATDPIDGEHLVRVGGSVGHRRVVVRRAAGGRGQRRVGILRRARQLAPDLVPQDRRSPVAGGWLPAQVHDAVPRGPAEHGGSRDGCRSGVDPHGEVLLRHAAGLGEVTAEVEPSGV